MNYKVGGVIVTYNTGENLKVVYKAIVEQVDVIVFVDNGSNNETLELINKICKKDKKCKAILNSSNMGIAKALNQGIEYLLLEKMDFILTLDHDSVCENNMIKNMLNIYSKIEKNKNIGIMSPAIFDINKKDFLVGKNTEEYEEIKEPIQSGSLIKSEFLEKTGLYNEELFIYYVDTDLCYRGLQKGFKMIQCNNIILKHEEGKKSIIKMFGKKFYYNNYSELAIYYRARNNIYMIKKYGKEFSSRDRLLKDTVKILLFDKTKVKSLVAHIKGIKVGLLEKWSEKEVVS